METILILVIAKDPQYVPPNEDLKIYKVKERPEKCLIKANFTIGRKQKCDRWS